MADISPLPDPETIFFQWAHRRACPFYHLDLLDYTNGSYLRRTSSHPGRFHPGAPVFLPCPVSCPLCLSSKKTHPGRHSLPGRLSLDRSWIYQNLCLYRIFLGKPRLQPVFKSFIDPDRGFFRNLRGFISHCVGEFCNGLFFSKKGKGRKQALSLHDFDHHPDLRYPGLWKSDALIHWCTDGLSSKTCHCRCPGQYWTGSEMEWRL